MSKAPLAHRLRAGHDAETLLSHLSGEDEECTGVAARWHPFARHLARRPRLLAEDLHLLCWDDDKGAVHSRCSDALAPGIGGALVLGAVLTEAVTVDEGRDRSLMRAIVPREKVEFGGCLYCQTGSY